MTGNRMNLLSLFCALTLVLGTGCASSTVSTSTLRLEDSDTGRISNGTNSKRNSRPRKRARVKIKTEIAKSKSTAEPAPPDSETTERATGQTIEKADSLASDSPAQLAADLPALLPADLPADLPAEIALAPTATPANRETASLTAKPNSRFRTLKPEVIVETGIEAADQVVDSLARPNGKSKREKLNEAHLIFDFPVTYNSRVRKWIRYFQTTGRSSFRRWLERSTRYIPYIQSELKSAGLPTDIAYVAMIESGFSSSAVSHANAMGMWQFIVPTGERYGLNVDWWIDERRDYEKATKAAIGYMSDLFEQFGSWYLVAASYNMGEGGVRRVIKRHKTNSFWDLADRGAIPEETRNYVPKMLAAMLIAKAPALYGFRDLEFHVPFAFESYNAPGGTDLINLANHLGVSERSLTELNPELLKGFIPRDVKSHRIRIPKGSRTAVAMYLNQSETVTR